MRQRITLSLAALLGAASLIGVGLAATPGVSQAVKAPSPYLVSLGDSYSIGYQPTMGGTPGYAGYVATKLKMQTENFGCGGATTSSLIQSNGCGDPASQDAVPYSGITQERAALNFIAAHPGRVGLITVSIGGNDFDGCSTAPCVESAMPIMESNIKSLLNSLTTALNAASDPSTKIIGITYPDVNLGLYVFPSFPASSANLSEAKTSIAAFDQLINPTLSQSYRSVSRGSFVNVTSAPYKKASRGDDTSFTVTQKVTPYGKIPAAVSEVCTLTFFCSQGNIHANTAGYTFIGKLIVADFHSH